MALLCQPNVTGRCTQQLVYWTTDRAWTTIQNMRVDHGRSHVGVPKKLLKCADVITGIQEMRRK